MDLDSDSDSSSSSLRFDILDIYHRYCDISSGAYLCQTKGYGLEDESQKATYLREALSQLLKFVQSRFHPRVSIFDEVFKLMSRLDLMVEFFEFSRFYDFVFFIFRENGQKSITVSRAVMAWRLVLAGRFRLLNQWCDYVEKNQRHNISEDTWRQVLAFSRCVHENLEGYDPEGAWPVLIDDFVEHMYRVVGSNDTTNSFCKCGDPDGQPFDDALPGLKICPGLKRKSMEDFQRQVVAHSDRSSSSSAVSNCKRRHICSADERCGKNPSGNAREVCEVSVKQNALLSCPPSPCAVEGCLAKGFAELLSRRSCSRFDRDTRVSYT